MKAFATAAALLGAFSSLGWAAEQEVSISHFEEPEFALGPLPEGKLWRNISGGEGTVEVVDAATINLATPVSGRVLQITRANAKDQPMARAIFRPLAGALGQPFQVIFSLAGQPKSNFALFEVLVGDSTTGAKGVLAGLRSKKGSSQELELFAGDGNERIALESVESKALAITPGQFYQFELTIDPAAGTYTAKVSCDGQLIAEGKDLHVKGEINQFNALIARVSGGAEGDSLLLDDVQVLRD